jgi:hypothetical protein
VLGDDRSQPDDGLEGNQMLGAVGHHQHDAVAGTHTKVLEGRRHPPDGSVEGGVGRGAPEEVVGGPGPVAGHGGVELVDQGGIPVLEEARNPGCVGTEPVRFHSGHHVSFASVDSTLPRYRTGDLAVRAPRECSQGRTSLTRSRSALCGSAGQSLAIGEPALSSLTLSHIARAAAAPQASETGLNPLVRAF